MNFVRGMYFMVVTMSTLGYGDFYPGHFSVRLWLMGTLLAYVFILSNDLACLGESLNNVSEFDTYFEFTKHTIIVGRYNDIFICDFIQNFFANI